MYIVLFLMYLRVPLYKYKFSRTYGYFCTSISSITPMGDLNKYKYVISTSMFLTGDLNKFEFSISTSRCISLLYEFMTILIFANEYLLLLYAYCIRLSMHVYIYKLYVPTKCKA